MANAQSVAPVATEGLIAGELYQQALLEAEAANPVEAIGQLQQAIAEAPEAPKPRMLLAALLIRGDRLKAAFSQLSIVLRNDSRNAEALYLLGCYFVRSGAPSKAISAFRLSAAEDPMRPMLYFRLGDAYLQQGDLRRALAAFRKELVIAPDRLLAKLGVGVVLLKQGRALDALGPLAAVAKRDPFNAAAYRALALSLARVGRIDEAVKLASYVRRISPQDSLGEIHQQAEIAASFNQ